jgi:hypothetical protein
VPQIEVMRVKPTHRLEPGSFSGSPASVRWWARVSGTPGLFFLICGCIIV